MRRFDFRRLLSAPNLMSLSRLPMAGLVWVAPRSLAWVGTLLVLAALSDLLDGWLARRAGVPGEDLGAWLDPLCDKAFVVSTLVAVWVAFQPPWWLAALAATREVVLLPLVVARFVVPGVRERHIPWKAKTLGKATTVAQFALFMSVLLQWDFLSLPCALASAVLGLGAGVQYTLRAAKVLAAKAGES
ncbi:MAG: CDP-diacylglycerol--glycerol-3-phosphate 3-phosphatidyltransferase [Myxococcaceae bacterium]